MTENNQEYGADPTWSAAVWLDGRVPGFADLTNIASVRPSNVDSMPMSTSTPNDVQDAPALGDGGTAFVGPPERAPWRNVQRVKALAVKLNMSEDRVVAALETMGEGGKPGF